MPLENDILSTGFLDFQLFLANDQIPEVISNNQSKIFNSLVVFESETEDEVLENLLTKILTAVNLEIKKDVCLLSLTAENAFSFVRIKTKSNIEKVILFGVPPIKLGINLDLKLYQPILFQDCLFLLAHSLQVINADKSKKLQLWNCLQEIYLK